MHSAQIKQRNNSQRRLRDKCLSSQSTEKRTQKFTSVIHSLHLKKMKKVAAIILLGITYANAFGVSETDRRSVLSSLFKVSTVSASLAFLPSVSNADELSEEEKARIARKMELLQASKSGKREVVPSAAAIRSDINPDAAVSLRSRSALENTKIAIAKQNELKTRDKAQKREDLCEMLGRGC